MNVFPEGFVVAVDIPFKDLNGAPVTPISVSVDVLDEDEKLILPLGKVTITAGATFVTITVPGWVNELSSDQLRTVRIVEAEIEVAEGIYPYRTAYMVRCSQRLVIMHNTFQTYESAEMEATELYVPAWEAASEETRRGALINSYNKLTNIPMRYYPKDDTGARVLSQFNYIPRDLWEELSVDSFVAFPTHFRRALRRAQVIEANAILQGDEIAAKHNAGIVQEKIGESSITLKPGHLAKTISNETLIALTGYIDFSMRLSRS